MLRAVDNRKLVVTVWGLCTGIQLLMFLFFCQICDDFNDLERRYYFTRDAKKLRFLGDLTLSTFLTDRRLHVYLMELIRIFWL